MLLQVHDELIFEIKDSAIKTAVPKLVAIMENVFKGTDTYGVPVEVEVEVGNDWNSMTKLQ
jgi:DNA polymerase-1